MHRRSSSLVFMVFLGLLTWAPSLVHGQTLEWDPNPEPDVDRYRVYHRTEFEQDYTVGVDVDNTTACSSTACSYQPQGVDWSIGNYFVVTAVNTNSLEGPQSNEAVWTPPSITTFTSVSADSSYPLVAGTPVTWTAIATNNLGPVEYRFYLYRQTSWTMVRDYDTSNTWTWTPEDADQGSPNYVQVWARAVGSAALFETWRGTQAFEILPVPLILTANVEFPTPPDNLVTWTVASNGAPSTPLEYRFQVVEVGTGNSRVFRDWAVDDEAQWTPGATGSYVVQALSRPVGSGLLYENLVATEELDVQPSPLSAQALYVDTPFPAQAGKPITWTARPKGGTSGPLQYQFWLYSPTTGWKNAQTYGASQSFTWTPTWGEEGTHHLQVWTRGNGSNSWYEAWRSSGAFTVDPADLHMTTSTLFPAPPGNPIQWTASVADSGANVEFQFWVYSAATDQWTIGQSYGPTNTFAWVPATAGEYAVQAWVRQVGSGAQFDALTQSGPLQISIGGAQMRSLVSGTALPVVAGATVTWTATASGGSGPLEYQFWRDDGTGLFLVQDYSTTNTYSWTTTALNVGQHELQVRVRSSVTSDYESYMNSGTFSVLP